MLLYNLVLLHVALAWFRSMLIQISLVRFDYKDTLDGKLQAIKGSD